MTGRLPVFFFFPKPLYAHKLIRMCRIRRRNITEVNNMKTYDLNLKRVFRAEQVRLKPYYDLNSYKRELIYVRDVLNIHIERVESWITGTDNGSLFNSEFKELMAEIVERGDVPKPRREAVKRFYAKIMAKLDDPKDRMILCQCIASMDDGEELNLGDMYIDDFNAALIEYKEAKGDE